MGSTEAAVLPHARRAGDHVAERRGEGVAWGRCEARVISVTSTFTRASHSSTRCCCCEPIKNYGKLC